MRISYEYRTPHRVRAKQGTRNFEGTEIAEFSIFNIQLAMFKLKFLSKLSVSASSRLSLNALLLIGTITLLASCSVRKQTTTLIDPLHALINDSALVTAHVGVVVYDPEEKKYLYDYQGDKYFVPASNTKIPTPAKSKQSTSSRSLKMAR